jgi:hypothetical protein
MIKVIFIFIALTLHVRSTSQDLKYKPKNWMLLNKNQGKELMKQCSRYSPKAKKFYNLDSTTISIIENNFKKLYEISSTECCMPGDTIKDLRKYIIQYLGVVIKGKKYVYVNGFTYEAAKTHANHGDDWQKVPIWVCDGGRDYWGVLFDVDAKTFSKLAFNGRG